MLWQLKKGDKIDVSPDPKYKIERYDVLVAVGSTEDINKIEEKAGD